MRYVIADIEATGLEENREMIEIALISFEEGVVKDVFETIINPTVPVSKDILDLTGITQRELDNSPKFYEIAERVALRLEGHVFVSHNVEFDWQMLSKAFEKMGRPLKCKTLCTLKLSQELIPGLRSYTLDEMCRFFNIKAINRHRALPDAKAALSLFKELKELVSTPRAALTPRYLPHHQPLLKKLPRHAGVLYFKDKEGVAFQIEAVEDLLAAAERALEVKPESRDLLERCEALHFEVTGSALIAQFKRARFSPMKWKWMITLEVDKLGEKFFHLKAFKANSGVWFFEERDEAESFLKKLKKKIPQEKIVWREGGKSKEQILEHNRVLENLMSEAQFPCENLLLWGPGRSPQEFSYVLVKEGRLFGWAHHEAAPEEVLKNPESVVSKKTDAQMEALAIRYLREHREKRIKRDQWRELKESSC
ncbi:MAG: 3'-5' exonuclease [Bacteriovoracaceae bacterium]|nr:3'-5' exonuclease [Bacteriovoracaceae bacterium]